MKVPVPANDRPGQRIETVRLIDWKHSRNNDFFLASQFWVAGDMYTRRPDLIGFVNGIPLVLVELKSPGVNVKTAYNDNLRDYKDTIPHLFGFNGFIISSHTLAKAAASTPALRQAAPRAKPLLPSREKVGMRVDSDNPAITPMRRIERMN